MTLFFHVKQVPSYISYAFPQAMFSKPYQMFNRIFAQLPVAQFNYLNNSFCITIFQKIDSTSLCRNQFNRFLLYTLVPNYYEKKNKK